MLLSSSDDLRRTGPTVIVHAGAVGAGAREFLAQETTARVVGRFRSGFYVAHHHRVIAVVNRSILAGPLHLRTTEDFEVPRVDEPVALSSMMIRAGSLTIELTSSHDYRPSLPQSLGQGNRWLEQLDARPSGDLEAVWSNVELASRRGELTQVRDLLSGRGQGLTPEGDDVLAGMLLVLAMQPNRRRALEELVQSAQTTDLSRGFLRWAAGGQSIEVVHELLLAAAELRRRDFTDSVKRLSGVGASSGNAMTVGLKLGVVALRRKATRELPARDEPLAKRLRQPNSEFIASLAGQRFRAHPRQEKC